MENNAVAIESHEKSSLVDLGEISSFVVEQMQAGASRSAISQSLVEMGIDKDEAEQLVDEILIQARENAEKERVTGSSIMLALLGSALAALIGGGIWSSIIIITGYEVGYIAWGLGLLTGYAAILFSKGQRGTPLQIIAVASSLLGILIGKYAAFFYFVKEGIAEEYGAQAAASVTVFSGEIIQLFIKDIGSVISGFDVLWVVFAVATAWSIPRRSGINSSD